MPLLAVKGGNNEPLVFKVCQVFMYRGFGGTQYANQLIASHRGVRQSRQDSHPQLGPQRSTDSLRTTHAPTPQVFLRMRHFVILDNNQYPVVPV